MTSVVERFLKYVSFDTQSDEYSETCPSTDKQKTLGAALVEEMKAMGIEDARMDEHGYVYGTVPGDPNLPTIGLIAHMDTSPDASGANVKAGVVEYDGTDILLGEESGLVLSEKQFPGLARHRGKHLIVTDGTTLLGADDKAGIAEIMTAAEFFRGMVPDDVAQGALLHRAFHIGQMDKAFIAFSILRFLGSGQQPFILHSNILGVDHPVLGRTGMDVQSGELHSGGSRVEIFILQFTQGAAVHRVGIVCGEALHIEQIRAPADLLLGGKTDF